MTTNDLDKISIKVKNYKCFGEEESGFDKLYLLNMIIGRNNSGKSTLLGLIEYVVNQESNFMKLGHRGKEPEVFLRVPLHEEALRAVFESNRMSRDLPGSNDWEYGSRWIDKIITYSLLQDGKHSFIKVDPAFTHGDINVHQSKIAPRAQNPLSDKTFKHLIAERNIIPESDHSSLNIERDGSGMTNAIQSFINHADLPRELVEVELLDDLNKIYQPDSSFSRILVQKLPTNHWEIYLEESSKGIIALSHTGSGFKTILAVLVLLHLIPYNEKKEPGNYIFAFEELENNLHPSLQRRLLSYLREFAIEYQCLIFLTTHSNVMIDFFSRDDSAQIIHVTHDGEKATTRHVQTYIDNRGILDDLDIRASDLLQANCVVWVEGPSDRVYFNRWIDLWTDGTLKEGVHYQCMFYGGRLLDHVSAGDPEQLNDGVAILRINRNAIIIIDSDKKKSSDRINKTKERIRKEITDIDGLDWVTSGREIENYIPSAVIAQYYGKKKFKPLGNFDDIAAYLEENISAQESDKFNRGKVKFAANICSMLTKDSLSGVSDLTDQLEKTCNKIKQWNGLTDE